MVRLTVLGGCGAWLAAGQACSGYSARAAAEGYAGPIAVARPGLVASADPDG
jgi:hypothetical protein